MFSDGTQIELRLETAKQQTGVIASTEQAVPLWPSYCHSSGEDSLFHLSHFFMVDSKFACVEVYGSSHPEASACVLFLR